MANLSPKPADIPRYDRIPRDVKTAILAQMLQELQSAPTLQTLLQNVYRIVREEFDSVGVLISIHDTYREELVYYSQGDATEPTNHVLRLGRGLAGRLDSQPA